MSDEYLHFPGGKVRKDDVVAIETKQGAGIIFSLFSMISLYALMVIALGFAVTNFIDIFLPTVTGSDGYNDSLASKIVAFLLFVVFFGIPILLLGFTAEGYKTGNAKYFKRGRWGAAIIGIVAASICIGYFFNPNSGLKTISFVIALVTAILAIVVIIPTFAWDSLSKHQVTHITLRSGQVIKVHGVIDTAFEES
jgi:hypothetical protein